MSKITRVTSTSHALDATLDGNNTSVLGKLTPSQPRCRSYYALCISASRLTNDLVFFGKNGIKRDGSETRQKDTLVHYVVILKKKKVD